MVMMWSAPATDSMFATSLADMGARLWVKQQNKSRLRITTSGKQTSNTRWWKSTDVVVTHCHSVWTYVAQFDIDFSS